MTRRSEPASSLTLRQQIYEALRHEILTGAWPAGQVLSEVELAERYGASRTPVREVLTALSREALVEPYPRRGYRVVEFKLDDVLDVFQVRLLLEPEAACLAAGHATPQELDRLEAQARSLTNEPRPGPTNVSFHCGIAELSGNRLLAGLVKQLNERMWLFGRAYIGPLDPAESDRAHLALVAALRRGDGPQARRIMQKHIQYTRSRLRRAP